MVSPRLLALALALAVTGCGRGGGGGDGRVCTAISCGDQVSVQVDQPGERPLEACVGTRCSPVDEVLEGIELGPVVEVVVRVTGGAEVARATATPTPMRPNGDECPVECRAVRLRLTVEDQLLPA